MSDLRDLGLWAASSLGPPTPLRPRWPSISRSFALVGGLALIVSWVGAGMSSAGTVESHCRPGARECLITFSGEIVQGDATRIEDAIRESPNHVANVIFDSPGGNPFEALKVSDVLNANVVSASTGDCAPTDGCAAFRSKRCASACALILLTANERFGSQVFLHRPTFPTAMFADMSGADAQSAYNASVDRLLAELRSRRVPEPILNMMMATGSDELVKLPAELLPYDSPWLEEWLTSKCGSASLARRDSDLSGFLKTLSCDTDAVTAEARRIQRKP